MKNATCPICDFHTAEEKVFVDVIPHGEGEIRVEGLRQFECPKCEAVFCDDEQSRHNLAMTQLACGEEPRYLVPSVIRSWREAIGLTQREAAKIFGGGLNAFSKYENGGVMQSDAMDNLLWLAMRFPGAIAALAGRRGIHLSEQVARRCGPVRQWTLTLDSVWDQRGHERQRFEHFHFADMTKNRRDLTFCESAANDEIHYALQA